MRPGSTILCLVLTSLTGCAALLGFDDFVAGTKSEEEPGDSGPGVIAEAEWYVSPLGADTNDGSRDHPVKSLRQAVLLASGALSQDAATVQRIAVCAGEYREPVLQLKGALEIRGGYECSSWLRPKADEASVGTSFASVSKLVNADPGDAFIVIKDGPGTSLGPHLDGLAIFGHGVSAVLAVSGEALLTELSITNDTVLSADAGGQPLTSAVAMLGANARLEHCSLLVEQDGIVAAFDSAATGVAAAQSSLVLRRNHIVVDKVAGVCQGLLISSAPSVELRENSIELTNCVGVGERAAAIGFLAIDSVVKSAQNSLQIEMPGNTDPTKPTIFEGIDVREKGSFESDGDRVIGPTTLQAASNSAGAVFYGFRGNDALKRVTNASIVLDSRQYAVTSSASSAGVFIYAPSSALLAHTSMYFTTAASDAGAAPMRGFFLNDDAIGDGGVSAVTIESNLIVTDDPRAGVVRASCNVSGIARLAHNRHAGFTDPAGGRGCERGELTELRTNAPAEDNAAIACPPGGCIDLFELSAGAAFAARKGLLLAPATACGLPLAVPANADVANDGAGLPRGNGTTTVGAFLLGCN